MYFLQLAPRYLLTTSNLEPSEGAIIAHTSRRILQTSMIMGSKIAAAARPKLHRAGLSGGNGGVGGWEVQVGPPAKWRRQRPEGPGGTSLNYGGGAAPGAPVPNQQVCYKSKATEEVLVSQLLVKDLATRCEVDFCHVGPDTNQGEVYIYIHICCCNVPLRSS